MAGLRPNINVLWVWLTTINKLISKNLNCFFIADAIAVYEKDEIDFGSEMAVVEHRNYYLSIKTSSSCVKMTRFEEH